MTLLEASIERDAAAAAPSGGAAATTGTVSLDPLDGVIEPRWWLGSSWMSPDDYVVDGGRFAFDDADLRDDSELADLIRTTYRRTGLVLIRSTGLTDLGRMREFAKLALGEEMAYDGGANPRGRIEPNVYEVGAPLSASLHYHHEMAYVGRSASAIGFLCRAALPAGRGRTFVSDSIAATDALLATPFGQRLKELGLCYHRNLTDRRAFEGRVEYGVYNHWQRSFDTEDPHVAAARAEAAGLEVEWGPDGLLRTCFVAAAFEYFPQLDRNVLYSSVADHGMWFDSWPLVQHLPYADRPLDLTFGDGTPFERHELQQFVDVYDRFGTPIDWNVGDIAVMCNYRFAHGRPGIDLADGERRELGVVLGPQFDRVGVRPDRWG